MHSRRKKLTFQIPSKYASRVFILTLAKTKHVIMQMKTLDYMLKVNTQILSLDYSLIGKAHKPYGNH